MPTATWHDCTMSENLFEKRKLMLVASLPAFAVVGAVLVWAHALFGFIPGPGDDAAARLAFVAKCLFAPACTLWVGVQFAGRRFLYPDAIDGTRTPQNHGLEINLRYNLNTLEQLVLAAAAWSNLALAIDQEHLVLIPAMAALFVVGRATFWLGYLWRPVARAFGMILTALPTAGTFVWLLAHWLSQH
jgi:hypothetical protein